MVGGYCVVSFGCFVNMVGGYCVVSSGFLLIWWGGGYCVVSFVFL